MFFPKITSRVISPGTWLTVLLLIDLTVEPYLQILCERREIHILCASGICDTKPAISLNQSSLEPKLLQRVYRNSFTAYRLVTNLVTWRELWPTLPRATFFHNGYLARVLSERDKIWQRWRAGQAKGQDLLFVLLIIRNSDRNVHSDFSS